MPKFRVTTIPKHDDPVRVVRGEMEGKVGVWDDDARKLDDYCYIRLDDDPNVRRLVRRADIETI